MKPKRDRKAEDKAALERLSARAAVVKAARDAYEAETIQMAQALVFCGIPYDPTKERQLSYTARLGDGSDITVTFTAAYEGIAMPYGADRALLYFLIDQAVKSKNRIVEWETALTYLTAMKLSNAGKNHTDFRKRLTRLSGLVIAVQRRGRFNVGEIKPIFKKFHLPNSKDLEVESRGQQLLPLLTPPYAVEFSEEFFNDFTLHHVPVPLDLLIATRGKSQLQDVCIFLYYRSFCAQSPSTISWAALKDQLWHADKTARRIKVRFAQAIAFLKVSWPELQAGVKKDGLWIAAPLNGQYFTLKAGEARRLR